MMFDLGAPNSSIKADDSIFINENQSILHGNKDSLMNSRWINKAASSEISLRNLQKFKEYAPKMDLYKATKGKKILDESKQGSTRQYNGHASYTKSKTSPRRKNLNQITSKLKAMKTMREGIRLPMLDCEALERAAKKRTGSRLDSGMESSSGMT